MDTHSCSMESLSLRRRSRCLKTEEFAWRTQAFLVCWNSSSTQEKRCSANISECKACLVQLLNFMFVVDQHARIAVWYVLPLHILIDLLGFNLAFTPLSQTLAQTTFTSLWVSKKIKMLEIRCSQTEGPVHWKSANQTATLQTLSRCFPKEVAQDINILSCDSLKESRGLLFDTSLRRIIVSLVVNLSSNDKGCWTNFWVRSFGQQWFHSHCVMRTMLFWRLRGEQGSLMWMWNILNCRASSMFKFRWQCQY